MSRAQAIETRLEKLLPSLEEYFTSGFLTREETHEVAQERTHWEYRLVARPLLLLDVQNAVAYELGLEKRLHEYCRTTKLILKHRWAVLERIEAIYRIAIKNLKSREESELVRREFIQFLKDYKRHSTLSAFYGELMVRYPTNALLWVEAALYEGIDVGNTDNARAIVQQAIITNDAEPEVWNAAFFLELYFADRLLLGLLEESQKEQQHEEKNKHDVVEALRAENAALANVVVDLALAKTVVEEAFESPACGQRLVQLLLNSAMRFSYTKLLVDLIMESAALNMASALTATFNDGCGKVSLHKWSEEGVSTFLHDYLTVDVIMIDRGVGGDAASYLRFNGRLHAATPAERSRALVKAFSAALTLLQVEIDAAPTVVRQLRGAAVAVMESLLEALKQTAPVDGAISSLCRRLILGQRVSAVEAVPCFCKRVDASSLRQLAETPAERVQTFVQRFCSATGRVKKSKHENQKADNKMWQLCRFLLPEDRKNVEVSDQFRATASCVTTDDIERLTVFYCDTQDRAAVNYAVRQFLCEFHLLMDGEPLESIKRLRYSEAKTPVACWKVFQLLEFVCETKEPNECNCGLSADTATDKGDEDEDEDNVCGVSGTKDESYAAAGLRFLASVPAGSLTRSAEKNRLEGCWGLLSARVQTLTGLKRDSDITRADFVGCLQRCGSDAWLESMRSVVSVARLCQPLPRQVLADIVIPFLEAVALERGGNRALQEVREAHETLIGIYSLSKHLDSFLPLVHNVLLSCEGEHIRLLPCELNAIDWVRFVDFERNVAKDLRSAKETAARARRMALEPQRLLAMLSAC